MVSEGSARPHFFNCLVKPLLVCFAANQVKRFVDRIVFIERKDYYILALAPGYDDDFVIVDYQVQVFGQVLSEFGIVEHMH
jgi:hypothetical protein